jgi:hypothetical protein
MSLKNPRKRAVVMAVDENGYNVLTKEYIKGVCSENGLFETPHLNTALYLHYKGTQTTITNPFRIQKDLVPRSIFKHKSYLARMQRH